MVKFYVSEPTLTRIATELQESLGSELQNVGEVLADIGIEGICGKERRTLGGFVVLDADNIVIVVHCGDAVHRDPHSVRD